MKRKKTLKHLSNPKQQHFLRHEGQIVVEGPSSSAGCEQRSPGRRLLHRRGRGCCRLLSGSSSPTSRTTSRPSRTRTRPSWRLPSVLNSNGHGSVRRGETGVDLTFLGSHLVCGSPRRLLPGSPTCTGTYRTCRSGPECHCACRGRSGRGQTAACTHPRRCAGEPAWRPRGQRPC